MVISIKTNGCIITTTLMLTVCKVLIKVKVMYICYQPPVSKVEWIQTPET